MSEIAQTIASIATLVASIAALIATLKGNRKLGSVELSVNGRLSQLIEAKKGESEAIGHAAGVEAERNR